ncbi:MAG: type I-D CRISPR-associated protein Cas10d/Csc3, partial [Limnochordia bacterium]|nr:type I-D CRISPR-associated protein Cas10d/Csc3 [Limnochordia bacterium]
TYLTPTNSEEPDLSVVPKVVRKQLVEATQNRLGELVKRGNFGIGYDKKLTELLDPVAAGDTIIRRTMVLISDSKPPVTEARKAKTQLKDGAGVTLELDYPESHSADRLAECMRCLCNVLQDYYGKDVTEHGTALIRALGMEKHLTPWESIDPKGGIAYGWYYIGGHYVTENPGMDPDELPKRMGAAYASVLRDLGEVKRKPPFSFLEDYIPRILTVGRATQSWDFQGELERYTKNKAPRSSTHICALCNSPFDNEAGFSSYSNKTVVGSRIKRRVQSQRYICEPCQAESILRRFAFGRAVDPSGKTKYLHLYPTYFFTPISGRAMLKAYSQLQSITFGEIAQPLQRADYDVSALVHDDVFKIFEPTDPKRWLNQVDYNPNEMHGYYLLGMPYLGKKPSATESWAMPAFAALFVPLVLGVKVVVSELALPVYTSGADFPETVVLDSPHQYWHHFMRKTRFRLDEIEDAILAAVAVYGITSDAYRDSRGFPIWNQLGSVAAKVGSDPLSVFGYADRITSQIGRGKNTVLTTDGLTPQIAKMLICYQDFVASYYESLRLGGENRMGMIRELVDRYAVFYRATRRSAHARLRPVSLAAEVVLKSPVELDKESLQLQIEGRLLELLDGVRNNMIDGWIPAGAYKDDERAPLVSEFARYFLGEVFEDYCHGDLSILRQRINLIKKGCEAYYVQSYSFKKDDSKEEMP